MYNYPKDMNIGIDAAARVSVASDLNVLLSNEFVLFVKTLRYHWNVQGKHFGPLHELWNKQYEALLVIIDSVAERIRVLDVQSAGTMEEYLKHATILEKSQDEASELGMVSDLLRGHEEVIRQLRQLIVTTNDRGDAGTSNFVTDLIEQHEKMAWMLRAHVAA